MVYMAFTAVVKLERNLIAHGFGLRYGASGRNFDRRQSLDEPLGSSWAHGASSHLVPYFQRNMRNELGIRNQTADPEGPHIMRRVEQRRNRAHMVQPRVHADPAQMRLSRNHLNLGTGFM